MRIIKHIRVRNDFPDQVLFLPAEYRRKQREKTECLLLLRLQSGKGTDKQTGKY